MLEKTTNEVLGVGVVGQVCIENVPPPTPRPTPPEPTVPPTPTPAPLPPAPYSSGAGATFGGDEFTFTAYEPTITIYRTSGQPLDEEGCTQVTDYQILQNTSEWVLDEIRRIYGPTPAREAVPLAACPQWFLDDEEAAL